MTEETKIKNEIKQYLKLKHWFVFHIMQRRWAYKGISDYIAIKDGTVLFIEVKTDSGKLSKEQEAFKKEIEEHGGIYIIARSYGDLIEWN